MQLKQEVFDYLPYTPLHNICGTTAMSVPLAWDGNGLPIGSHFAARAGGEATCWRSPTNWRRVGGTRSEGAICGSRRMG